MMSGMPNDIPPSPSADDCFGTRYNRRAPECRICFRWDAQQKSECRKLTAAIVREWEIYRRKISRPSPHTIPRSERSPISPHKNTLRAILLELIDTMPLEFTTNEFFERVSEIARENKMLPPETSIQRSTILCLIEALTTKKILVKTRGGYLRLRYASPHTLR